MRSIAFWTHACLNSNHGSINNYSLGKLFILLESQFWYSSNEGNNNDLYLSWESWDTAGLNLVRGYVGHSKYMKYMITVSPPFFTQPFKAHISGSFTFTMTLYSFVFSKHAGKLSVIFYCRKLQVSRCITKKDLSTKMIPCSSPLPEYLLKLYHQTNSLVTSTN